jgi:2-methylcitrate dehydratase PrpD
VTRVIGKSETDPPDAYLAGLLDWLACARGGVNERAALAVRASGEDLVADVAFAGTAGHVLDFDDIFPEGVAHVSAICAPAALVLAGHLGLSLGAALRAYAHGFEAMASLAASNHPALYDRGWHPTAVCGAPGAAIVASQLLDLSGAQRSNAIFLSLSLAGGTRGAFGSDAKAIQVGLAAAAGVRAALLARAGASADPRAIHGPLGFEAVFGASLPRTWGADPRAGSARAIDRNWIKLYPSCLGTHSPIEAAVRAREAGYRLDHGQLDVFIHPLARQAAHLDIVSDGLSAKFSIPYCVAHTLIYGPPQVRDFARIDPVVRDRSGLVTVSLDRALPEFGARLAAGGTELARVSAPKGAPERPVSASELADKVADLAGDHLQAAIADLDAPALHVLHAARLAGTPTARASRAAS